MLPLVAIFCLVNAFSAKKIAEQEKALCHFSYKSQPAVAYFFQACVLYSKKKRTALFKVNPEFFLNKIDFFCNKKSKNRFPRQKVTNTLVRMSNCIGY